MSVELRRPQPSELPLPVLTWDHNDPHGHSVQFYADDEFLLDGLSRYIGGALGAGDVGIVIATVEHRDALARRLEASGINVRLALAGGRYLALDADETLSLFMVDGWPDASRFNQAVGGVIQLAATSTSQQSSRIAAFGEMVAILWSQGLFDAAIRLEQLWNELAQVYSFGLHCAYPMRFFTRAGDDRGIGRICGEHGHVVPSEGYLNLTSEAERYQAIAVWQQKAQALASEVEERKRIEHELYERNQELEQAIAVRDEFLSVAAHELKTPLTSLRAYSQLLLRARSRGQALTQDRIEKALSAIEQQTGKLNQLVTRLLDTSRIEAGKLRLEPVVVDLVELVRSAVSLEYVAAGHQIELKASEPLPARVDPIRFEQVVTNLLDNALKFSPDGGNIVVELQQTTDRQAEISVTDWGVGIPADERARVFARFQQAHADGHLSGLGLGLYISREIVELHGGSIRIEQPEHPGTRFVVTVPLSSDDVERSG